MKFHIELLFLFKIIFEPMLHVALVISVKKHKKAITHGLIMTSSIGDLRALTARYNEYS